MKPDIKRGRISGTTLLFFTFSIQSNYYVKWERAEGEAAVVVGLQGGVGRGVQRSGRDLDNLQWEGEAGVQGEGSRERKGKEKIKLMVIPFVIFLCA